MPSCCVPNCNSRTEKGIRVFIVPQGERNKERRDAWIKNINRTSLPIHACICELHFEQNQFENNRLDGKRPLKNSAIPTIFNIKHIKNKRPTKRIKQEPDIVPDAETPGDLRRSKRKRKEIKFEEYNSEDEEDESKHIKQEENTNEKDSNNDNIQNEEKDKVQQNIDLIRCRTCLATAHKDHSHIMKKMLLGKTVKQIILMCVPELAPFLEDNEYVCNKCARFLIKLILFIESCLDSQEKLSMGTISLDVKSNSITETADDNKNNNTPRKGRRSRKQDLTNIPNTDDEDYIPGEILLQQREEKVPIRKYKKTKVVIKKEDESTNDIPDKVPSKEDEEKTLETKSKIEKPDGKKEEVSTSTNITESSKSTRTEDSPSNTVETDRSNQAFVDLCENNATELVTIIEDADTSVIIDADHNYVPKIDTELLKCPNCQIEYRTLRGIKAHLTSAHGIQEQQTFECNLCKMKFIRYKDMVKHRNNHGCPCELCDKLFETLEALEAHRDVHPEQYCCVRCGVKFKKQSVLNKHIPLHVMMSKIRESIKNTKKRPLLCPICKVPPTGGLIQHLKSVHGQNKDHNPESFDKNISSSNSVKEQIKIRHPTDKQLVCMECGLCFSRIDHLKKHNRIHCLNVKLDLLPATDKGFNCIFCDVVEDTKESLLSHLTVHANARKFECKHCSLKFSSEEAQNIHQKSHCDPNYKHVCIVCWLRFTDQESLVKHETIHEKTNKLYCCICGESFIRLIQLETHIIDTHMNNLKTELNPQLKAKHDLIEFNKKSIAAEWDTDDEIEVVEVGQRKETEITSETTREEDEPEMIIGIALDEDTPCVTPNEEFVVCVNKPIWKYENKRKLQYTKTCDQTRESYIEKLKHEDEEKIETNNENRNIPSISQINKDHDSITQLEEQIEVSTINQKEAPQKCLNKDRNEVIKTREFYQISEQKRDNSMNDKNNENIQKKMV